MNLSIPIHFLWPLCIAFGAAAAVAWLLVHTRDLHLHLTGDHPESGPQKLHDEPTPRIGGLSVMAGLVAGLVALYVLAPPAPLAALDALQLFRLGIGFLPLFALGLIEDVSKAVSVRLRMGVSLVAGLLAYFLAGVRIESLGLPVLDALMHSLPLVPLSLTLVAVAGLVHAMNIVDGLNGLLAGITLVILGVLAGVSAAFGETGLLLLALTGMAATLGFAVFNFPRGRLFCGDAGAYLIGYLIAVIVILLVLRQKTISPWFALAVVIHPVTETLYSAWRRWRQGFSPTHPDARHMHSLWAANLRQRGDESGLQVWLGPNAGASWRTQAVASLPVLAAATCPTQTLALQGICLAYVGLFVVVVRLLERPVYGVEASRFLTDEPR
ncbi:MAG: glycosyltransferase [Burkholderiaceae bacterium]|jgi:UDP-N-acetylmuramyl pentapeptide phosphotransferase/UDP-N-acetylglucosamine-1-phosphate transferase